MSIENPTLAHFRHFSSLFTNLPAYKAAVIYVPIRPYIYVPIRPYIYVPIRPYIYVPIRHYICREPSTNQLLFMQNKPNFRKSQMSANLYDTTDYENIANWTLGENKPNSNPIAERVKLMQSVYLQRIMKKNADMGYEKTKPIQTQFPKGPK